MSSTPEGLLERAGGQGSTPRATAIDGRIAFVVGDAPSGAACSVIAQLRDEEWTFVAGGMGSGSRSFLWARSDQWPPGILGAGWRVASRQVHVTHGGETVTLPTSHGWFAWVRVGVEKSPVPEVTVS